jgi:hypothetical protein
MGGPDMAEAENRYLYIYQRPDERIGYIGIGPRARAGSGHDAEAEAVRTSGGRRLVTRVPFATSQDAEMAESVAIYVAQQCGAPLVNKAKLGGGSALVDMLPEKDGKVGFSELRNSIIVTIKSDRLSTEPEKALVSAETSPAELAKRCQEWWSIGRAASKSGPVRELWAVSSQACGDVVVLGTWETAPVEQWVKHKENNRLWSITLKNPDDWDFRHRRGMTFDWEGRERGHQGAVYSSDLR